MRDGTLSRRRAAAHRLPLVAGDGRALAAIGRRDDRGARAALADGVAANLAGGTHHAFADRGEGYCVFNDVAVAARVLQREGASRRVAVVDCDVHQGNGTAAIFRDDPTVFTFSMHGAKNFPFRKEVSDLDVRSTTARATREYLAALAQHLRGACSRDTARTSCSTWRAPIRTRATGSGRLKLTIDGPATARRARASPLRRPGSAVVITMSGGYAPDIDAIVSIHANTIAVAAVPGSSRPV